MSRYAITGGREGKERLDLLARVMSPTTSRLLELVGLGPGMTCLDVGCGGGHVALHMAGVVGPGGRVVGTDVDGEILALARDDAEAAGADNVEFRRSDAASFCAGETGVDLAYARFLLSHLGEPGRCIDAMAGACRPGGLIVVEDIDFAGSFCHPPNAAYERYTQLYRQVVLRRGGDPNIGPKLPGLLRGAGVEDIRVNVVQPAHLGGDGKFMASVTMERISRSVVSEGLAGEDEVAHVLAGLNAAAADPATLMSLPRVFQAWGRRS